MALPVRSEVTNRPLGKSAVRPHSSAIGGLLGKYCPAAPVSHCSLLGKVLSAHTPQPSAASWEKYFPATPVSLRQPLGKTCCRASPAMPLKRRSTVFGPRPADAAVRSGRSSLRPADRRLLRIDAVGNFLAKYQYVLRRLNAQADLVAFHPEHPHGDTVSDPHSLAHPARQNQHAQTPFRYSPAHKPCARRRIMVGIRRHESRKCTKTRPRERSCRDGHRHPIQ